MAVIPDDVPLLDVVVVRLHGPFDADVTYLSVRLFHVRCIDGVEVATVNVRQGDRY